MDRPLAQRFRRHVARARLFPRPGAAVVAVSGGADSVCLLHVLREIAPRWSMTLSVVHVNHNLRGDGQQT